MNGPSRSATPHPLGKCDTELKTQVPERLRDELATLATLNGQTVFKSRDPACALAQEARVSARVNSAIKRGLLDESSSPVVDAVTREKAYPLYPHNYAPQRDLFSRPAVGQEART